MCLEWGPEAKASSQAWELSFGNGRAAVPVSIKEIKNLGWHTLIVLIKTWVPCCLVCVCFLWEPSSCPTTERVLSHDSDSESSADVMAYIVLKKCLPCRKWNKVLGLSRNGVRIKRLLWICGFSQAALEMSHANPNSIWVTDSLQPAFLNRLLVF